MKLDYKLHLAFFHFLHTITIPYGMVFMQHQRKHIITSLKKARGSLDTVIEMAENGTYCADIAHQINAVMGLLKSANRELMRDHLQSCGREKLSSPDSRIVDGFIDELLRTWDVATRK